MGIYSEQEHVKKYLDMIQKYERNGTTETKTFGCDWKSMDSWVGTKN